jgi:hypothetical protein
MTPKIRADIKKLQDQVLRLKPGPAPGMLTSRTTRGVVRRPIRSTAQTSSQSQDIVPEWG